MTRNKSWSFFYTLWTSSETQNKQSSRMWRETKAALSSTHCDRVLETQNKQSCRILRETKADLFSTHFDHLLETQNKCNINIWYDRLKLRSKAAAAERERERKSQRRNTEELRSEEDIYTHTGMHAKEEKEGKKPNQKINKFMYRAGQLQRHWWQKTLAVPSLRRYAPVLHLLPSPFTASAGPRTVSLFSHSSVRVPVSSVVLPLISHEF
jgi:hypothetical protein